MKNHFVMNCVLMAVGLILGLAYPYECQAQRLRDGLRFGDDQHLEVVTWNIEWFPKVASRTPDYVAEIIRKLDADVYALQEIDDTSRFRQVVAGLRGYRAFMPVGDHRGLAYVYKTSTVQADTFYRLFRNRSFQRLFPRRPLLMEVRYDGERYVLINNHYKCCGNGRLEDDSWDEERRRLDANVALRDLIAQYHANDRLILLGDLNDVLNDGPNDNVFKPFLDQPQRYRFVTQAIADGPRRNWSFPNWPSHLDHLMVTDELFEALERSGSTVRSLRIDDYLPGGWTEYDTYVSDHRPVGLKLAVSTPASLRFESPSPTKMRLYPNPATGKLRIEAAEAIDQAVLFDMAGRKREVWHDGTGQKSIGLAHELPAGLYLVKVRLVSGAQVSRLWRVE